MLFKKLKLTVFNVDHDKNQFIIVSLSISIFIISVQFLVTWSIFLFQEYIFISQILFIDGRIETLQLLFIVSN
jgi:hypothetical protein